MPLMMTDLAVGSRAAEQFQQDIAEAPYVSDITQTGAERKLQENRLALQYAPEEAAAKAEKLQLLRDQERINALYAPTTAATKQAEDTYRLQKTIDEAKAVKTKTLFDEANYKADTESTDKFKTWMASDDGVKANDVQRLEKAAQFKAEAGLTKQAAALNIQIESINAKEIANQAKELTAANESIASARALITNVPDNEVADYIKRLPNNLQKIITNRVGEENWNKLDGKQKKNVLEVLFQNAKQQVAMQVKEVEKEKAVAVAEEATKRSNFRANKQAESRGKGNSGNNTKADAQNFSNVMKVDERLEKASNKGLDALDKKVIAAEKTMVSEKAKWFNSENADAASTAYTQAVADRNTYAKKQLEKRITVVESAPDYSGKKTYLDSLRTELSLYGPVGEPPPAKEGKAAPSDKAVVPSNKGVVGTQAAPIPFEPGKTVPENGKYYSNNKGDVAMWDKSKGKMVTGEEKPVATPAPAAETPAAKPNTPNMRPDGTAKGNGYLGVLKASDGSDVTEYSMSTGDVKVKGKEIDFPTIVPTLTKEEVKLMLTDIIPNNKRIPDAIANKAIDHAKKRIKGGRSVFADKQDGIDPNSSVFSRDVKPAIGKAVEETSKAVGGFVSDSQKKYLESKIKAGTLTPAEKVRAKQLGLIN